MNDYYDNETCCSGGAGPVLGVLAALAVTGLVATLIFRARGSSSEPLRQVSDMIHDAQDTIRVMESALGKFNIAKTHS